MKKKYENSYIAISTVLQFGFKHVLLKIYFSLGLEAQEKSAVTRNTVIRGGLSTIYIYVCSSSWAGAGILTV
jgi:hypothetical protein